MWYKLSGDMVEIQVVVKPNARQTQLVSVTQQALQISLHAKPHEGEANKALIVFLSELFQIPKTQLKLKRGDKSRHKSVLVPVSKAVLKIIESLS